MVDNIILSVSDFLKNIGYYIGNEITITLPDGKMNGKILGDDLTSLKLETGHDKFDNIWYAIIRKENLIKKVVVYE